MRREKAIEALSDLKAEAATAAVMNGGEGFTAWKGKVRGVVAASVGGSDHLLDRFDGISYSLGMWTDRTPQSAWDSARHSGIRTACGVIDAAIYQLELLAGDDEPVDERAFDPELWDFVKGLVEVEDWGKVASQTAIFVENHVRMWAGDPKDKNGDSLVGKGLFAAVLADDSDWRLGTRAAEREGWRFLGMGFAQALSNVDRHRIQKRDDGRRYAIGVLGLGSLLLTQLRWEHEELMEESAE
jgi:hypothetical protein